MTISSTGVTTPRTRSLCPISCGLDLLGDKWSLVIIRDLFLGAQTYGDLQAGMESIPSNILAARLKQLLASGIINKTPYQQRPLRYHYGLTQKGKDLQPLMIELLRWSAQHIEGVKMADAMKKYLAQ